MKSSVYPSKIDWWLAGILILAPISPIVLGAYSVTLGELNKGISGILTGLGLGVVIGLFSIPCYCKIIEKTLIIRCGLETDEIPIERITNMAPIVSFWAAPTLSVRRVKIETLDGTFIVSPKNREQFVEEVTAAQGAQ